jgi:hypothetical protein
LKTTAAAKSFSAPTEEPAQRMKLKREWRIFHNPTQAELDEMGAKDFEIRRDKLPKRGGYWVMFEKLSFVEDTPKETGLTKEFATGLKRARSLWAPAEVLAALEAMKDKTTLATLLDLKRAVDQAVYGETTVDSGDE